MTGRLVVLFGLHGVGRRASPGSSLRARGRSTCPSTRLKSRSLPAVCHQGGKSALPLTRQRVRWRNRICGSVTMSLSLLPTTVKRLGRPGALRHREQVHMSTSCTSRSPMCMSTSAGSAAEIAVSPTWASRPGRTCSAGALTMRRGLMRSWSSTRHRSLRTRLQPRSPRASTRHETTSSLMVLRAGTRWSSASTSDLR